MTFDNAAEGIYKEKGSRFIAYGWNIISEEAAKELISQLKKKYHDARHHCYAYRLMEENISRSGDDGEPSGTAGRPLMNILESLHLFNAIIIVVRYFGGTLLGRNRLASAYRSAALDMISKAQIVEKYLEDNYLLEFHFSAMNEVMKVVKDENLPVVNPLYGEHCSFVTRIRKGQAAEIITRLQTSESFRHSLLKEI